MKGKKSTNRPKATLRALKIPKTLDQNYGCLVFAVIGDYKGRGEDRVILHEVEQSKTNPGEFAYGHLRTWYFPVK